MASFFNGGYGEISKHNCIGFKAPKCDLFSLITIYTSLASLIHNLKKVHKRPEQKLKIVQKVWDLKQYCRHFRTKKRTQPSSWTSIGATAIKIKPFHQPHRTVSCLKLYSEHEIVTSSPCTFSSKHWYIHVYHLISNIIALFNFVIGPYIMIFEPRVHMLVFQVFSIQAKSRNQN